MMNNRINQIIIDLTKGFNSEERETSILFDHHSKAVYLETSHPATALRWRDYFKDDDNVQFDNHTDTLKIRIPWDYARQSDLIIKAKHRKTFQISV